MDLGTHSPTKRVMLLRALSKLGACSRQQAKRAILAGHVQVNGKVVTRQTHWVSLGRDRIALDGQALAGVERKVLWMLNKPRGYVTTRRDNLKRPTVFDLLASLPNDNGSAPMETSWIFPVGRLDYNSEGLLLFTNDGALGEAMTSPERHVDKVYRVLLDHLPAPEALRRLERGIQILDCLTLPCKIEIEAPELNTNDVAKAERHKEKPPKGAWVRIALHEGKNRQVRRMFAAVDCEVRRLIRICFGPLELGDLPAGHWRALSDSEVRALHRVVNLHENHL